MDHLGRDAHAMNSDLTKKAEQLLLTALETTGARDPREFYRDQLRELRELSLEKYEDAVTYYEGTLIPSIASDEVDPLHAWAKYGRLLALALAPGETVQIDETGRASSYVEDSGFDLSSMMLHMPNDTSSKATVVTLPSTLSEAQKATYQVLVAGKQKH